jgi:hypothetical protein
VGKITLSREYLIKKMKRIILNQHFTNRKLGQKRKRVEDIEVGRPQKRTQIKRKQKVEHISLDRIQSDAKENKVTMNDDERNEVIGLPSVQM